MIELGKIQKLEVIRATPNGVYLNSKEEKSEYEVLLPKNQVNAETETGDEIEVFIYRDSEDRMVATTKTPKLTLGQLAVLKIIEITKFGAFLDWGLNKDLFMPYKEQVGIVFEGDSCLVSLYIDKSERLCATMKIYNRLSTESPYKAKEWVAGTICNINPEIGAFVAVSNQYQGLIPNKELYGSYHVGDHVDVRIKRVLPDGKLELSLRKESFHEIEGDTQKIIAKLQAKDGFLLLNDKSDPEQIKAELNISKNAFKRAVGKLLKEGAIEFANEGIKLRWQ